MIPGVMRPIILRLRRHRVGLGIFYLSAGTGVLLLLAVFLDALLAIPATGRVVIRYLLPAGLCGACIGLGIWAVRIDALKISVWLESLDPSLGSKLSNAVQFVAEENRTPGGMERADPPTLRLLRERAIALGRKKASGVDLLPFIRTQKILAIRVCLAVLIVGAATGWFARDVVKAVLPRYVDPSGDHPPFSRLRLTVSPGDVTVLYGQGFEVRAQPLGRPVDRLYLVTASESGTRRTKLFRSPDRTYFQTLSNIREDTRYYVTDGRARSKKFRVMVRYTPQITAVRAHLSYPEYTGMPQALLDLADNSPDLVVPQGTRILLEVVSNRPLSHGNLRLTPANGSTEKEIRLEASDTRTMVTGSISADAVAAFELEVVDTEGLTSTDNFAGRFLMKPDEAPRLVPVQPGRHAVAVPQSIIPIRVEAGDDYGIKRIIWFRGINQTMERPLDMTVQSIEGRRSVQASTLLNLEDLGVLPGEMIEYYFEAVDNNPRIPNLVTSRLFGLEIISNEAYQDLMNRRSAQKVLLKTYEILGQRLRALLKQAEDVVAGETGGTEMKRRLDALLRDTEAYRGAIQDALDAPLQFDIEHSFRKHLSDQLTGLDEILSQKKTPAEARDPAEAASTIARLLKKLVAQEAEAVAEPIRHIKVVAAILARAGRFTGLYKRQLELNRLSRRFEEIQPHGLTRTQRMELNEIAHHQRRIRDAMEDLTRELRNLRDEIPEDPVYTGLNQTLGLFLMKSNGYRIVRDLDAAADGFFALLVPGALMAAQRATEHMEALIRVCDSARGEGEQCLLFLPSLSKGLGNTLNQIVAAMNGKMGSGGHGYAMLSEQTLVYGPESTTMPPVNAVSSAAASASGGRNTAVMSGEAGRLTETTTTAQPDGGDDTWVPPRYRRHAEAYFRKIAETKRGLGDLK